MPFPSERDILGIPPLLHDNYVVPRSVRRPDLSRMRSGRAVAWCRREEGLVGRFGRNGMKCLRISLLYNSHMGPYGIDWGLYGADI